MIRASRIVAAALGAAVLGWQVVNWRNGRFVHDFLPADLILGTFLVVSALWKGERGAAAAMLGGFAAMGGVFLSATTLRMLRGGYDMGTALTTLGLVPCLIHTTGLGRWLVRSERG